MAIVVGPLRNISAHLTLLPARKVSRVDVPDSGAQWT